MVSTYVVFPCGHYPPIIERTHSGFPRYRRFAFNRNEPHLAHAVLSLIALTIDGPTLTITSHQITNTMSKPINHIVWFKYKEGVDKASRQSIFEEFLKLKEACILKKAFEGLPATNAPYIWDIRAGHQSSKEAIAADIDVGHSLSRSQESNISYALLPLLTPIVLFSRSQDIFVVIFPTAQHRDYYVSIDDAHANFVKEYMLGKVDALVADFENVNASFGGMGDE